MATLKDGVYRQNEAENSSQAQCLSKVLSHPLLAGSDVLASLLRYLVRQSQEAPGTPIKEHQIATEILGRPDTFDPRLDSSVRVHVSRLRTKLEQYYKSGAGSGDAWRFGIPRGSHVVVFHRQPEPSTIVTPELPEPKAVRIWHWRSFGTGFGAGLLVCLIAAIAMRVSISSSQPRAVRTSVAPSLQRFWNAALSSTQPPLVIFSNPQLIGRPETGLRYATAEEAVSAGETDGYTGTGEVLAIHVLDQVFAGLGRTYVLKRAQLMNWDESRNRDLIFIGSTGANLPLRELSFEQDFAFRQAEGRVRKGDLGIVNLHPRPGEADVYFATAKPPITEDYAVIAIADGPEPGQRITLLGGTTTYGTEAAVEFVAAPRRLASLWSKSALPDNVGPKRLSALLHIDIKRGVPLTTTILAVRAR